MLTAPGRALHSGARSLARASHRDRGEAPFSQARFDDAPSRREAAEAAKRIPGLAASRPPAHASGSMSRRLALALAMLVAACSSKKLSPSTTTGAAAFPAFPKTEAEARELVERETRRPPPPTEPELDAAALVAAAEARGFGQLPAGHGPIVRWIQSALERSPLDAYLLFGTYHDAPGQLDAFRRLVGPGGVRGLHVVAAEQFRADGEWQEVPSEAQRGDTALLDHYRSSGDPRAFEKLAEHHRESDYAAWKLGYEDTVLDLLVQARATGVRFAGCDMPAALQDLSGALPSDLRNRLREIHCLRSLPITWPRRAALIWGDAHVRKRGLARFIIANAGLVSIHAFGQRQGDGDVERELAKALVVNDPVLIPLGADEAALLLPDAALGGRVDRVMTKADAGSCAMGVTVHADVEGTFTIGDRTLTVGSTPVTATLSPGDHAYAFKHAGRRILGALRLAEGHCVELAFESSTTSYVERVPR
ncbi:Hypothetical protein A7982_01620 [Minicystis rosea]|nr:Hypothetical protein A7982_01620 [Minicystis rosea]